MIPVNAPVLVYRKTDLTIEVSVLDSADDPVPITGWTFAAHVRRTVDGELVLDLEPAIADAAQGLVRIFHDATVTEDLTPGKYVWDFIAIDPDGNRTGPYLAGEFVVKEPVTK